MNRFYFPIQKSLKIWSRRSSTKVLPRMPPRDSRALLRSTAIRSSERSSCRDCDTRDSAAWVSARAWRWRSRVMTSDSPEVLPPRADWYRASFKASKPSPLVAERDKAAVDFNCFTRESWSITVGRSHLLRTTRFGCSLTSWMSKASLVSSACDPSKITSARSACANACRVRSMPCSSISPASWRIPAVSTMVM